MNGITLDRAIYACPVCKSTNLDVSVRTWAQLKQEPDDINKGCWTVYLETDLGTAKQTDHEWDDDSIMECRDCHFCIEASHFKQKEDT